VVDGTTHLGAVTSYTFTNVQADHTIVASFAAMPVAPPVGGEWVPINKSALLAPWMSLGSVTVLLTASFVYVKRKKKQMN
jgi:hypothetical protein